MTPERIRDNREMTEDLAAVKEAVLELGLVTISKEVLLPSC
jgi:hypothetical protein